MHPARRYLVSRQLSRSAQPGRVLFLCQGNVCRSPFAEALFRREIGRACADAFDTTSAGFVEPDRRPPREALAAANRMGLDLSTHRSKLVTDDLIRGSVLVVVMSRTQAYVIRHRPARPRVPVLVLGDLDPFAIESRTIRDPWNCAADVFDDSYARIDRCVRELVRLMTSSV
jgi:protein-tyrosine-phosphatase